VHGGGRGGSRRQAEPDGWRGGIAASAASQQARRQPWCGEAHARRRLQGDGVHNKEASEVAHGDTRSMGSGAVEDFSIFFLAEEG